MGFHHRREVSPMSYAFQARDWAREIERREADRTGQPVKTVRPSIARRIGTTAAALEHVSRGRAKRISAHLFAALQGAFIRELSAEIARAEHEIEMARQCGVDPRAAEMAALEAGASAARKLMGGK